MQAANSAATRPNPTGFHQVLSRIELYAAALAIVLLVTCSLTIILLRMLSQSPAAVSLVDTLSQYPSHLMLVAALLGGSLALTRGEALKIEVLNSFLGEESRKRVARMISLLGLLFYLGFIALAVRYLTIDYRPVVAFVYLPLFCLIGLKLLLVGFGAHK
jgi:TRAP-type C4-dicarboxylate transport system permease small subunit